MPEEVFPKYPTAAWTVGGKTIKFPTERIEETGGNRIAKHKRLYRRGARCDDTGAEPKGWRITIPVFNSVQHEAGIDGANQYPDLAVAITDSFDVHEVGTLTTPTRGERRCRAEHYTRSETSEERDFAALVCEWTEDNEDDESVAAYSGPTACSALTAIMTEVYTGCEMLGANDPALGDLRDLAADLQGMAEAPWQFVDDMDAKVTAFEDTCQAVEDAFTGAAERGASEGQQMLTDPSASFAGRRLRALQDISAGLRPGGTAAGAIRTTTRTYQRTLSIFDVAIDVGQSPEDLLNLNRGLPDVLAIQAKTPVTVYEL